MTLSGGFSLRLVIVGLSFLIALQIALAGAAYVLRTNELGKPSRPVIVDQIASATRLIDRAAPEERIEILRAVSSPFLAFSLAPKYRETGEASLAKLASYRPLIRIYERALEGFEFSVYARRRDRLLASRRPDGAGFVPFELVLVVRLSDGSALTVQANAEYRRQQVIAAAASLSSILGLVLLAGLVWASLATTRPLRRMAQSAAQIAADLNAPAIEETGPKPVQDLARAFNAMQRDLKKLVSERTVALAAVAHDYRTYLTRLRLRVDEIDDETQREKAIADIDEMSALIDDTLLFARQGAERDSGENAGGFSEVNIDDLAVEVATALGEAGERVSIKGAAGCASIRGSRLSLQRALTNLVDNAVKYGGAARMDLAREGDSVVATIRDDGEGAPEDVIERLSEPFYRGEHSRSRNTGGAGLGLAIASSLVDAAGGTLTLANEPDGGLVATVRLRGG